MSMPLSRVTVIKNDTAGNVVMKVRSNPRRVEKDIVLKPGEDKEIGASKYSDKSDNSGLEILITIHYEGTDTGTGKRLTPHNFVEYGKISFTTENDELIVKGFKAELFDFCRLKGFGWLGREYGGRPEHIIENPEGTPTVDASRAESLPVE